MPTRRQIYDAVLAGVQSLTTTVQQAQIGAPAAPGFQKSAFLAIGGGAVEHHTTGTLRCVERVEVAFCDDVSGDPTGAMHNAADFLDDFQQWVYTHKTLGGIAKDARIMPAGPADYETVAGAETLVALAVLQVTWDATFNPNQP